MVPLEYKGGAATGPTELIFIGILALAIIAIGLLLMRSMKRIQVPYADDTPNLAEPSAEADDADDAEQPRGDRPAAGTAGRSDRQD